ncbi:MAG: DUF6088 family protein [Bacteroidota bacterium]
MSVENQIRNYITRLPKGKIFFPEDFARFGSEEAVRQALHRMDKNEFLIRLAQGIYLYPKEDEVLGVLYPSLDEIARAIAKRDRARIIPTGIQALNTLGLSTQVPMKAVYLTDGAARDIQVGNSSIKFKRTTPKNLAVKGAISGLVIQALRALGKDHITPAHRKQIRELLQKEDLGKLLKDASLAPAWIRQFILESKPQQA